MKRRVGKGAAIRLWALALAVLGGLLSPRPVRADGEHPASLWLQTTASDFGAWTLAGVAVAGAGTATPSVRLAPAGRALTCAAGDVDGGATSFDSARGLCAGVDPVAPGGYLRGLDYYNGGSFWYGTMTSPVVRPGDAFDQLVASWDADTPPGTWIEARVRVLEPAGWTHWYRLPVWAADAGTIHRHSVPGQADATGDVAVDTFAAPAGAPAATYQLAVTLFTESPGRSPAVRLVGAIASSGRSRVSAESQPPVAWGTDLAVPRRSQMLPAYRGMGFGGGGEVWCSPTSTSMVLAYWAHVLGRPELDRPVPRVAAGVYDYAYDGTGNWPFNAAYAADAGLVGYATRMGSLAEIEPWIRAGVPLVISVAFGRGELPGAPVAWSAGHLLVVRGFTARGDVIANDPAAPSDARVRIVYPRAALERAWLGGSRGTVYVIYPPGWPVPAAASA